MLPRICIFLAGLTGAAAVVLGAYEDHGVKKALLAEINLSEEFAVKRIEHGEKATEYQIIHAGVLLAVGLLAFQRKHIFLCIATVALFGGVLFFCGGLHYHCLTGNADFIPLVPYGGGMLIVGWIALGCSALVGRPKNPKETSTVNYKT